MHFAGSLRALTKHVFLWTLDLNLWLAIMMTAEKSSENPKTTLAKLNPLRFSLFNADGAVWTGSDGDNAIV